MSAQPQPLPQPQRPQLQVVHKPEPTSSKTWIWLALLGLTAFGGGYYYLNQGAAPVAIQVSRTAVVRTGSISKTLRLSGTTAAERSAQLLVPQLPGNRNFQGNNRNFGGGNQDFQMTIATMGEFGSRVKKGDTIATFDIEMMRNRFSDAASQLQDYQGRVEKSRANADLQVSAQQQKIRAAKARLDKAELDMKTSEVRSAIQAETYKLAYEQAKAEYEAVQKDTPLVKTGGDATVRQDEIQLQNVQLEMRRSEANLARFTVQAPIGGVLVAAQMVRNGNLSNVRAGDQLRAGQQFLQIADLSSMIVNVNSHQMDVPELRIGAKAGVRFDAFPDLELPAHVYSVNPLATSGNDQYYVRTVPLRLQLERTDARVVPDLSVSADVVIRTEDNAPIVPRAAIFTDADGKTFVQVKTAQGWARRDVELGLSNNVDVAIRTGLKAGEEVSLDPPAAAANKPQLSSAK
jgi:multidrug resistance efflux pump